jgi:hypothetical protein
MRHFRLKFLQVLTGILFAFTAKDDASFSCACKHFALLAIRTSFVRSASIALDLFLGPLKSFRNHLEPFRIFRGANEYRTCLAIKAAYGG